MNQHVKRVLVTGAGGFIGSHLCKTLLEKGYAVVGLHLEEKDSIIHLKNHEKFSAVQGDITNTAQIQNIFKTHRPQGVFHTAAKLPGESERDPDDFFDINAKGTLNILEACRKYGVRDIVYSSTMSVYGKEMKYLPVDEKHPTSPYDFYSLSKLQGEEACHLYSQVFGLNAIILRYSGVYGLGKTIGAVPTFFRKALKNEVLEVLGNTSWDIVHVQDVVEANILAFEKAKVMHDTLINIGSGEEIGTRELADMVVALTHSASTIQSLHSSVFTFRFFYDIQRAKELLDFTPKTIVKGLKKYYQELQKYNSSK